MKKQLLLFLLLLMPLMASADVEIDGIYYNLNAKAKIAEVTNGGKEGRYSGKIIIPPSVQYDGETYSITSIAKRAFINCPKLNSVRISDSVEGIGDYAFYGCSSLSTVTFGNNETRIGVSAFYNCYALTSIKIPNSIKEIESSAFYGCSSLTSITIPSSVFSLGTDVFRECKNLVKIIFEDGDSNLMVYSTSYNTDFLNTPLENLYIGRNIIYNSGYVDMSYNYFSPFKNLSTLKSLTIGKKVTYINNYEFYGCDNLESLTIGENVKNINTAAFEKCKSLVTVNIPNSVIEIGDRAFTQAGIQNVSIGNSVKSIGVYAFLECKMNSLKIPSSVTIIKDNAFYLCGALKSLILEDGTEELNLQTSSMSPAEFSGCPIEYLYYGRNTQLNHHYYTFNGMPIKTLIIGSYITSIPQLRCPELENVFCYAEEPPQATPYTFQHTNSMIDGTLHVIASSINKYKNTVAWKDFKNIVALTDKETGVNVMKNENVAPSDYYLLNGQQVDKPLKGLNIIKIGNKAVKVLMK